MLSVLREISIGIYEGLEILLLTACIKKKSLHRPTGTHVQIFMAIWVVAPINKMRNVHIKKYFKELIFSKLHVYLSHIFSFRNTVWHYEDVKWDLCHHTIYKVKHTYTYNLYIKNKKGRMEKHIFNKNRDWGIRNGSRNEEYNNIKQKKAFMLIYSNMPWSKGYNEFHLVNVETSKHIL